MNPLSVDLDIDIIQTYRRPPSDSLLSNSGMFRILNLNTSFFSSTQTIFSDLNSKIGAFSGGEKTIGDYTKDYVDQFKKTQQVIETEQDMVRFLKFRKFITKDEALASLSTYIEQMDRDYHNANRKGNEVYDPSEVEKVIVFFANEQKSSYKSVQEEYDKLKGSSWEQMPNSLRNSINQAKHQIDSLHTIYLESYQPALYKMTDFYNQVYFDDFTETTYKTLTGEDFKVMISAYDKTNKEVKLYVNEEVYSDVIHGGWNFVQSSGVNFSSPFDGGETYQNQDDVVVETEAEDFNPNIMLNLNMRPQVSKPVSIGGSFGLGTPINDDDVSGTSINFFAGPTVYFGRNQFMSVNTGVSANRAQKLGDGLSVGDITTIPDPGDDSQYKLGGYLGFSFNLLNLTQPVQIDEE